METTENVSTNGDLSISGDVDIFINQFLDNPFQLTSYQKRLCNEIAKCSISAQQVLYPRHHGEKELRYFMNEISKEQYKGESNA